mgnify:CR=1 FL=1
MTYRAVETEIDVECCEHCHGDPEDCDGVTSSLTGGAEHADIEPIPIDWLLDFVAGRYDRTDLIRELLKRKPTAVVI